MRTPVIFALAAALIVGLALVLNAAPLTTELVLDAFALAFLITLLSLQSWLRRRYVSPKDGAGRLSPPGNVLPRGGPMGQAA